MKINIENDVFDIVKRIKEIDKGYFSRSCAWQFHSFGEVSSIQSIGSAAGCATEARAKAARNASFARSSRNGRRLTRLIIG